MQDTNYTDARVLLYGRAGPVLRQTMSILTTLGFRSFLDVQDLTAARQVMTNQRLEFAVLTVESKDCGVLKMVDDIRHRRCGDDPFLPILLTATDARLKAIRPVINSGADDMLLHPFSVNGMGRRIKGLVKSRKPFVVTEDYFGPDRRSSSDIKADLSSIVVPNALQALVQSRHDVAPNAERIEASLAELRRLKLRTVARSIWYLANCLNDSLGDPSLAYRYEDELTKIRGSIRIYERTLAPGDDAELARHCDNLSQNLAQLFGMPPDAKSLNLLEQSAVSLRTASKLDFEENDSDEFIRGQEVGGAGGLEAGLIRAVVG